MIIDLSITVDYHNGEPVESFKCKKVIPYELGKIYSNAIKNKIPLNSVKELSDILTTFRNEIETRLIEDYITAGNKYVCRCEGIEPLGPEELNSMIADHDKGALKFFGLENATEEELKNWDASKLDVFPLVKEFYNGHGTRSPFHGKWELIVTFAEPDEN